MLGYGVLPEKGMAVQKQQAVPPLHDAVNEKAAAKQVAEGYCQRLFAFRGHGYCHPLSRTVPSPCCFQQQQ
jgi:hypothetical protein